MNHRKTAGKVALGLVVFLLAGCEVMQGGHGIVDGGIDGGPLEDGVANIWVDPDGCQHWVIDDGIEGYMSPRLDRDGKPRCQDTRGEVVMKDGSVVASDPEPVNPAG